MESKPSLVFNNCCKQDTSNSSSDLISINIQNLEARTKKQVENEGESCGRKRQTVLDHSAVPKGHIEMALSPLEKRLKEDQLDAKCEGDKNMHVLPSSNVNESEVPCCSYSGNASQSGAKEEKSIKKRVTIHINSMQEQNGKLIILPDTLEELFRMAGEFFFFFPNLL